MRKLKSIFLLIPLLFLSSCSMIFSRLNMLNNNNDGQRADARMEQIVSAIKNDDREALKSLFSKKALDEAIDIDNRIEYLFDFLQGDKESWERDSMECNSLTENGKKSDMLRFSITIEIAKNKYSIFVIDYNIDTINPDNEGVYMLEVSKSSYSSEWDYWQNRMCAGISIVE